MTNNESPVIQMKTFPREDGSLSLWDHPSFSSYKTTPKTTHRPTTTLMDSISHTSRWNQNVYQARLTILKVIGDAVCANENQLRRYMALAGLSASQTSEHIRYLRDRGFVDRHKCYIADYLDANGNPISLKNPAPITLGIGGWYLMNHFYSGNFFAKPDMWFQQSGSTAIQRYVALNEIRCAGVEAKLITNWRWYPVIGSSPHEKKPFALMQLGNLTEEFDDRSYMLIERAQMSQRFIDFLRTRLEDYRRIFTEFGYLKVAGVDKEAHVRVILSVSSYQVAKVLHESFGLHKYPFDVWVLVDEWFDNDEEPGAITSAFARPSADFSKLQRIRLSV